MQWNGKVSEQLRGKDMHCTNVVGGLRTCTRATEQAPSLSVGFSRTRLKNVF